MNWIKKILGREIEDRDPAQSNAYDLIGGDQTIRAIAKHFYQAMQLREDTQQLLAIHPHPLSQSEQKLYEFLSGWLGGPQLFQRKYGNPMLRARHMHFAIDDNMRDQWLRCMAVALEQSVKKPEHRQVIYQAIAQLADHMRNQ